MNRLLLLCIVLFNFYISTFGKLQSFAIEGIRQDIEECREELSADVVDVIEIIRHKPASTDLGKCLRACVLEKLNVLSRKGDINIESLTYMHVWFEGEATDMGELVQECGDNVKKKEYCAAGEEFTMCVFNKLKDWIYF